MGSIIEEFGPYFVKHPLRALFDDVIAAKGYGAGLNETIYKEEVLAVIVAALAALDETIPPYPVDDALKSVSVADWSAAGQRFLARFEELQVCCGASITRSSRARLARKSPAPLAGAPCARTPLQEVARWRRAFSFGPAGSAESLPSARARVPCV